MPIRRKTKDDVMVRAADDFEKEALDALDKGRLKRSARAKEELHSAKDAAEHYLKKDQRINIRLSAADLRALKRKAVQEGLPYQTLIASILHKFASGTLFKS